MNFNLLNDNLNYSYENKSNILIYYIHMRWDVFFMSLINLKERICASVTFL